MALTSGSHGAHVLLHVPINIRKLLAYPSYLLSMACLGYVFTTTFGTGCSRAKLLMQALPQGLLAQHTRSMNVVLSCLSYGLVMCLVCMTVLPVAAMQDCSKASCSTHMQHVCCPVML